MTPTLILLNGASSAGKTTLARELQRRCAAPLLHAEVDAFARMLPPSAAGRCLREASKVTAARTVQAFHEAAVGLVRAGESVVADHVLGEDRAWVRGLIGLSGGIRILCVGVHCERSVLLERERNRRDRAGHEEVAARQHETIHDGLCYDVEVDTTCTSPVDCAQAILEVLRQPAPLTAWESLKRRHNEEAATQRGMGQRGCVQVYTGDGKGKTTAATGLVLRAVGSGRRVFIGQFIKGNDSAEMRLLRQRCPEVTIEQFGRGRFVKGKPALEDVEAAARGMQRLREVMAEGTVDLVMADEINGAIHAGLIEIEALLHLIALRPPHVELVLTGRNADPRLLACADLVTEMKKIKHYFDAGVPAREGMEY